MTSLSVGALLLSMCQAAVALSMLCYVEAFTVLPTG